MPRTGRVFTPRSFSEIPIQQTRALSAFVALEDAKGQSKAVRTTATLVVCLIVSLWIAVLHSGLVALLFWAIALTSLGLIGRTTGNRPRLFASPYQALIAKLNRDRYSVGLDSTLPQEQLITLESSAVVWERIEHMLASHAWESYPDVKQQAGERSHKLMSEVVRKVFDQREPHDEEQRQLLDLSRALAEASKALDVYARPSSATAGAPLGAAFPQIVELQKLL